MLTNAVYLYFVLAIGYNLVSQLRADLGKEPLAPTDPPFGILMMSVLFVIWSLQDIFQMPVWAMLIAVYLYLIARFGVWRHLVGYAEDIYLSRLAWRSAIGINLYGLGVLGADVAAHALGLEL
ncbi:hypothetical protein [Kordiimonas sp.]|uniref:hypothetical protein n=1 Tax=Kordiimonas sp. TaxID=1970157 RepID=UPI003A910B11